MSAVVIHPTAVVHPQAQLQAGTEVGPYAVIGEHVRIGARCKIGPHVVIDGHTSLGDDNVIHAFAALGCAPQDKKYAGEATRLIIGDRNTVFQYVTISTGTVQDKGLTQLGHDNWIMAYVHIAHDCQLGNHLILANNTTLAGHVYVDDWVFLGGFTTVHQFCRIGTHAMTAFTAAVSQDVPPFVTAAGNRAGPTGINAEGLRRRGYPAEAIRVIKRAYKTLYREGLSYEEAKVDIAAQALEHPVLQPFLDFFARSERGLIR
jgi:UDP-N-acetylglucosamine acyltransferase